MNKIENLISILQALGGSASVDEIARTYCKSKRMIMDSSYKSIIHNVLLQNNQLVKYSKFLDKWELIVEEEKEYLYVSDDTYYHSIKDIMNVVFGKLKFPIRSGYIKIDSTHMAWFPKFDNDEWKNEYDPNGKYWYETPKDGADYQGDGLLRYIFSFDKKLGYKFTGVFKPIENKGTTRVYELVDDKVAIQSKRTPMILCRIAWMNNYQGLTANDIPSGGGRYIDNNQDGFEKYNFLLRENGYYAFVETMETKAGSGVYHKICIENIDPTYNKADSIDGVRVVFVARHPNTNKMLIVGWYDNATIYRERQNIDGNIYMMHCSENDAHLISTDERTFEIPTGKNAIGQSNFFYIQSNVEQRDLEYKIIEYIDSLYANKESNFYYEPVNLNEWDMFEKVEGEGHIEYFLATSQMKVNDYLLLHVGSQKSSVASGVYGVAKVIEKPAIYTGNVEDYCYNKLSVKTQIIKYSEVLLLEHQKCKKFITQFRKVHKIDSSFNAEIFNIFFSSSDDFNSYLSNKIAKGLIGESTRDSYLGAIKTMNKQWVGNILPQSIYDIDDIDFLKDLYNQLLDSTTEIGAINHSGKFKKSSAIKVYIEYLEEKQNH